jgi:Mg-chelatase subunit ChlD
MKKAPYLGILLSVTMSALAWAQSPRNSQRRPEQKPANPVESQAEPPQGEVETLKIDTNLVTVPVIASSHTGAYIADLRKEEFNISEDGVAQEIAFFATVNMPFHVVLLLDTSDSTQEKLGQIQQAAIEFLDQLGPRDRVKIISFNGEISDLNDFTSNKSILRDSIRKTRSGHDTRVYDAMQAALDALRPLQTRKAIVMFTDGMDWHSETSTFESTTHDIDESGVIVYPIRFETRAETERLARKQQAESNGVDLPTSGIIRQPPNGTTAPTFPSEDPFPSKGVPRSPLPIPPPSVIFGRGNPNPPSTSPTDPFPDTNSRRTRDGRPAPDPTLPPDPGTIRDQRKNDTLSGMLDNLYLMADSYLKAIADRSGGQLYRADNVGLLPQAFAAIAAELRTQYLLGYYPTNRESDTAYRKIQVKTSRKDVSIRARPGYRAHEGG